MTPIIPLHLISLHVLCNLHALNVSIIRETPQEEKRMKGGVNHSSVPFSAQIFQIPKHYEIDPMYTKMLMLDHQSLYFSWLFLEFVFRSIFHTSGVEIEVHRTGRLILKEKVFTEKS